MKTKSRPSKAAGTQIVWVVDPEKMTVTVYTSDAPVRVLKGKDRLSGGGVVRGFELQVEEIFEVAKP